MTGALTANGQAKEDTVLPKVDNLKPVIVRPKELRPRLKGDTVEYNTGNIQLRPNANVEELLGRLPGLHIDPDGTITYNGVVIKQLLVDGEDFFANSPTLVTRNFDASKIIRVQLLDRKSDHARFTGIDDGVRTKTLNLIMSEDSKKGYFGKLTTGADAQGAYNISGLLASFRGREQISALGFASNIGATSNSGDGGVNIFSSFGNDALGASAGTGIPRIFASALHYANTWNGETSHLMGNYQFSNLFTRPVTTTNVIQTLPDSIYNQRRHAQSVNRQNEHFGYGTYDWTADSLSAFQFSFRYNNVTADNQFSDTSLSAFNSIAVNRSQRRIWSADNRGNLGGGISWRIRSSKNPNRIFAVSTDLNTSHNTTDGYLYSLNRFYRPDGELQEKDTIDQRIQLSNRTGGLGGNLSLAQPLWGINSLGIMYGVQYNDNESRQFTFNKGDGKYQDRVDSLSSHFKGYTLKQAANFTLQGNDRRLRYSLGVGMAWSYYRQKDLFTDSLLHFHYFNLLPRLFISYTFNPATKIDINYSGSPQQLGVSQIQSTRSNNDPLHIVLGNPGLRSGYNQNWSIGFSRIKAWMYSLTFNMGLASNNISTKTITDSLGRQISQPVNVDGGRNLNLSFFVNKKLWGLDAGINSNVSYSRNTNYVNADLSRNDSYTSGVGFRLGKYVPDRYSFQLGTQFTWFDTRSSINTAAPVHYWAQSHSGDLRLLFLRGFEIMTNAVYTWQQKTSDFTNNTSVILLNASVSRNFMNNRLVLKFQGNNLLNQNSGISRTNVGNVNTETSTNILGRYLMLSLTWRFDHKYKNK